MIKPNINVLEGLARLGYFARGLVFLVIGALAALAAWGSGGRTTDGRGALQTLLAQPFGRILMAFVALGLLGFAIWRVMQAVFDADGCGTGAKGLLRRAGRAVGAVSYGALALSAAYLALGTGGGGGGDDSAARDWTAWAMQQPAGRWLVAAAGVAVAVAGIGAMLRAWKASFADRLSLDATSRRWVLPLGRAGFAAHGVVLLIVGGFLLYAAWMASSAQAVGLAGALRVLQEQPYGWIPLGLVAVGLAAFGVFNMAQARYRRIAAPEPGDAVRELAALPGRMRP